MADVSAFFRLRIAEGAKLARVRCGKCDAAANLNAAVEKELLHAVNQGIVGNHAAAVGVDVNLVDFHWRLISAQESQPLAIFHVLDNLHGNINSDPEMSGEVLPERPAAAKLVKGSRAIARMNKSTDFNFTDYTPKEIRNTRYKAGLSDPNIYEIRREIANGKSFQ